MRTIAVVMRAQSCARVREGDQLQFPVILPLGRALATFHTDFVDEGYESRVPRDLVVEVVGAVDAPLAAVINAFSSAASDILPLLAVMSNAPIDDLEVYVAYDRTEGVVEHEFFQQILPEDVGLIRHGRAIPSDAVNPFLTAIMSSNHRQRLSRACGYYREALKYLRPGQEIIQAQFLWMAVEALTKVAPARACASGRCTDNDLVLRWGLAPNGSDHKAIKAAKRGLDGETQRRLIFHADSLCHKASHDASNAFEHGFADASEVRRLAIQAKAAHAAQHVRRSILEFLDLPPTILEALSSGRYSEPKENWLLTTYVKGILTGPADRLAAEGQLHPLMKRVLAARVMQEVRGMPDGTHTVTQDDTLQMLLGLGVTFKPGAYEVWGPANDAPDQPGESPL